MRISITYDQKPYDVSNEDFLKLEEDLKELDRYPLPETALKTDWIIYKFLRERGYDVKAPALLEPPPAVDLFDMEASEGATAEVVEQIKSTFVPYKQAPKKSVIQKTYIEDKSDNIKERPKTKKSVEDEMREEGGELVMFFFLFIVAILWVFVR